MKGPTTFADIPGRPAGYEAEYRRGYRDGWIQAVEAMHDLMFQAGMARQAAYERCWKHGERTLWEWSITSTGVIVQPPEVET